MAAAIRIKLIDLLKIMMETLSIMSQLNAETERTTAYSLKFLFPNPLSGTTPTVGYP